MPNIRRTEQSSVLSLAGSPPLGHSLFLHLDYPHSYVVNIEKALGSIALGDSRAAWVPIK
jgi:hypothetical protein